MSEDSANQQSTQALDYSSRLLEAVTSLTVEIGKASSKDEVLALIPSWVPRIVPADRASVTFPVDDDHLEVFAFQGDKAIPVGVALPIARTMIGSVFTSQEVKRCSDLSEDARVDLQMLSKSLGSTMVAPMVSQGRTIGTLNVGSFEKHAYSLEQETLLLHIAAVIGAQLSLLDRFFETQEKLEAMVAARTQQIERQKAEIEEAMREAQSANRLKSEFLASISHELRTPMNGIIGVSEIMLDYDLDEQLRADTSDILESAETLLALIDDVLDLSKIEAGSMTLEASPFDLQALVDQVVEALDVDARAKGLDLIVHFALGTPRFVIGDPMRIRQILTNLIGNAVKFTEQGRVLTTVELASPASGDEAPVIKIAIEDTGVGVPRDKHAVIFERFTQGDGSWNRQKGGTGLGLAICKELVELMNGTIGVESDVGVGSRFWFRLSLPIAPPSAEDDSDRAVGATDDDAVRANQDATATRSEPLPPGTVAPTLVASRQPSPATDPSPREEQAKTALEGLQVLLVEDNRLNREVARNNLVRFNIDVTTAENGEEAVDWVKTKAFDAILMDCQMPVMDGFEATRIISAMIARSEIPRTPIIAITANAMKGDRERCLEAGMDDYVPKPIRTDVLGRCPNSVVPSRTAAGVVAGG